MERRVLLAVQLSDLGIQIRKDSGGIRAGRDRFSGGGLLPRGAGYDGAAGHAL